MARNLADQALLEYWGKEKTAKLHFFDPIILIFL
jgi:hypothetical protein